MNSFTNKTKAVEPDRQTYIIAELSANHNGSLESALELIHLAKDCGVDAVKLQTYTADTLTIDCDSDHFRIDGGTLWDDMTLYRLYEQAATPWQWHKQLFAEADSLGLDCFSTPFDESAVDFLEQFDPPYHKVASFELIHHPLLRKIASTHRPVIMSTGMASLEEISEALTVLREHGCPEIILLKCTSSYPAPAEEANLARIPEMAERFGLQTGLSDHTMDIAVPVTAVALGATVIEKHLCKSREQPGPDSAFSLEPQEFKQMVEAVRIAEKAIGKVTYDLTEKEKNSLNFRRSLFVVEDIKTGERFTEQNVRCIRPGYGLAPKHFSEIMNTKSSRDIKRGTPLEWAMVEK